MTTSSNSSLNRSRLGGGNRLFNRLQPQPEPLPVAFRVLLARLAHPHGDAMRAGGSAPAGAALPLHQVMDAVHQESPRDHRVPVAAASAHSEHPRADRAGRPYLHAVAAAGPEGNAHRLERVRFWSGARPHLSTTIGTPVPRSSAHLSSLAFFSRRSTSGEGPPHFSHESAV